MAKIRKKTLALWVALLLTNAFFLVVPRAGYQSVVVHHSASEISDFRSIRRDHQARGWFEIAYHFVLSNGSTDVPRSHLHPTRRYVLGIWSVATRSVRFNFTALHLCVVGNFENSAVPGDLRLALGHALAEIQSRHDIPAEKIFIHRDCSATACPGRFIDRDRLVLWARKGPSADPTVKAQHHRVLDRFHLTKGWYVVLWVLVNLLLLSTLYKGSRSASPFKP